VDPSIAVGPEQLHPGSADTFDGLPMRVPERVPTTGGGDRDARSDRVEKLLPRGVATSVVAEHEGLGTDRRSPLEQRVLAGMLQVARDDQSARRSADDGDERPRVAAAPGLLARRGDDAEGYTGRTADRPGRREDDRRTAAPRLGHQFGQPGALRVAGRDPQLSDLQLSQHRERTSHVVEMVVRHEEDVDATLAQLKQRGEHDPLSRVETAVVAPSRVHEHRASRRAERRDRQPLADIEDRDLQRSPVGWRNADVQKDGQEPADQQPGQPRCAGSSSPAEEDQSGPVVAEGEDCRGCRDGQRAVGKPGEERRGIENRAASPRTEAAEGRGDDLRRTRDQGRVAAAERHHAQRDGDESREDPDGSQQAEPVGDNRRGRQVGSQTRAESGAEQRRNRQGDGDSLREQDDPARCEKRELEPDVRDLSGSHGDETRGEQDQRIPAVAVASDAASEEDGPRGERRAEHGGAGADDPRKGHKEEREEPDLGPAPDRGAADGSVKGQQEDSDVKPADRDEVHQPGTPQAVDRSGVERRTITEQQGAGDCPGAARGSHESVEPHPSKAFDLPGPAAWPGVSPADEFDQPRVLDRAHGIERASSESDRSAPGIPRPGRAANPAPHANHVARIEPVEFRRRDRPVELQRNVQNRPAKCAPYFLATPYSHRAYSVGSRLGRLEKRADQVEIEPCSVPGKLGRRSPVQEGPPLVLLEPRSRGESADEQQQRGAASRSVACPAGERQQGQTDGEKCRASGNVEGQRDSTEQTHPHVQRRQAATRRELNHANPVEAAGLSSF